jgi:chromosomal replication initiation ATPase DnaA
LPALKALANRPDIEHISQTVDSAIESNDKLSRLIKLYLCHSYSGSKLKEIGTYFSIGESGVTQTSRRLSDKLKTDKVLRKKIKLIENKLNL